MSFKARLERNRFLLLFISLITFFLLNPLLINSKVDLFVSGFTFSIVLIVSVYVVEHNKKFLIIAGALAVIGLIGFWLDQVIFPHINLDIFNDIVYIILFSLVTYSVLSSVVREQKISDSTLYGAICGYLLIGLLWSTIYALIYSLHPQSFNLGNPAEHLKAMGLKIQYFIYYSFVTLSTLGYGDITPVNNAAKTFAWFEAVIGQIYLTVWIAQLVGLHIANKIKK
jgi:voltage-gated potassium channel